MGRDNAGTFKLRHCNLTQKSCIQGFTAKKKEARKECKYDASKSRPNNRKYVIIY